MIVDASALVSILLDEEDGGEMNLRLDAAAVRLTHPVSIYETVTALVRSTGRTVAEAHSVVDRFLAKAEIVLIPIGPAEGAVALEAFARYGKGRHPASLNMGDCFAYACARVRGLPLLYKGRDFAQTDLA